MALGAGRGLPDSGGRPWGRWGREQVAFNVCVMKVNEQASKQGKRPLGEVGAGTPILRGLGIGEIPVPDTEKGAQ